MHLDTILTPVTPTSPTTVERRGWEGRRLGDIDLSDLLAAASTEVALPANLPLHIPTEASHGDDEYI